MEPYTDRGRCHLWGAEVGVKCLQTPLQFRSRQHRPPGMFRTGFRDAKQYQNTISAKKLQGPLVLLGKMLGQGKKCLAQALQRLKS